MARLLGVLLLVSAGCRTADPRADELDVLARWLTGTFTSESQAQADPENFFPIRLVMVPVWPDRGDGPWLYVEQASMRRVERPYRQRVYHLTAQANGVFRSDVYLLPGDPLVQAGKWDLAGLTPGDLALREGCSIYLRRVGADRFSGATQGRLCKSRLGEAAYATSRVEVARGAVTSWDRGFDESGRQAWGATKGPYVFRRVANEAP